MAKRGSTSTKRGETDWRKAFTIAVAKRTKLGWGIKAASDATGIPRQDISHAIKRYPDLFAEVRAQAEKELEKVAPDMIQQLAKIMNLAANIQIQMLASCLDKNGDLLDDIPVFDKKTKQLIGYRTKESLRDVVGAGAIAIEKAQLLKGEPTENLNVTENVKVEIIHQISEVRAEMNSKNRISGLLGNDG